jgi:cell division protein ZapA (FtsZ GTPase activity inhibitor)
VVGCEDGQEAHLTELARLFDTQVRQVSQEVGQLGETRLFLMAALLLADELSDLRGRHAGLQSEFVIAVGFVPVNLRGRQTRDDSRPEALLALCLHRLNQGKKQGK